MKAVAAGLVAGLFAAAVLAGCTDDARVNAGATAAAAPVAPMVAGEVIFSEIMPDPLDVVDTVGEWLELYNTATETFNLLGCTVTDLGADGHGIFTDLIIDPGQFITLAVSSTPGFAPTYVYPTSNLTLGNVADELILTCGGTVIDSLSYTTAFGWTVAASGELSSATLDATSNDTFTNWCAGATIYATTDRGTPNAPNDCP